MVMLSILAGVVLALGTIFLTRHLRPTTALRVFAVGLVVTAFVYVVLAVAGGAGARWIAVELLGVVLYGALAWFGVLRHPSALALGWAAHPAWDLAFHLGSGGAAFTPAWYPWLCLGFDLPIAIHVMQQGRARESIV